LVPMLKLELSALNIKVEIEKRLVGQVPLLKV
jgi:hypothetical protein